MAKIQILVGSVNGTAMKTAMAVAHVLNHQGHDINFNDEPDASDLVADSEEAILICCSTTGNGELPANLYPVFYALDDQAVNLEGRNYGVIALGDSSYQYFIQAGLLMENALYNAGARRVGQICELDARKVNNHPLAAATWANEWVEQLAS